MGQTSTVTVDQTLAPPTEALRATDDAQEAQPAQGLVGDPDLGPTGRPLPVFPAPAPLTEHGGATVIAMCNQKGGVGKTTTTINLGASLPEYGRRVLLVDFHPQASLTVGLGINPNDLDTTIYHLMLGTDTTPEEVVLETGVEGMDLIPSNIDFAGAEMQLINEVAREQVLARALKPFIDLY